MLTNTVVACGNAQQQKGMEERQKAGGEVTTEEETGGGAVSGWQWGCGVLLLGEKSSRAGQGGGLRGTEEVRGSTESVEHRGLQSE